MLSLAPYLAQRATWPRTGRHILAQHDDASIVVYQAFRQDIAEEAAARGRFGGSFSRSRMSWIKPNFLWMMYRCGWATKVDQERVLAVRIARAFFERALVAAVASSFDSACFASRDAWQRAVATSEARLQWDPDHGPSGAPLERRAVQIGLRGALLAEYAGDAILEIADVTPLVTEQRAHATAPFANLEVPVERVYVPTSPAAAAAVGLDRS